MGKRLDQAKFTASLMERLEKVLKESDEFGDIFLTDNLQTLTFCISEDGEPERFASVKLTLHKTDWDLEDAIEAYEDKFEKFAADLAKEKAEAEAKAADGEIEG